MTFDIHTVQQVQRTRTISVSEAGRLFDCEAAHAFAYTGHLTGGDALTAKQPHLRLREGRAWGAAVAEWHATGSSDAATYSLDSAIAEDTAQLAEHGLLDSQERDEMHAHLAALLGHYIQISDRIPLFDAEREFRVPIPSRTGRRKSSRYVFVGHVDGLHRDEMGRLFVVEFKLRGRLSSFEQIAWSRQVRWYAWAVEQELGSPVAGVIVDERLNAAPKAPRILKSGRVSHAKDQLCTASDYAAACELGNEPVDPETYAALGERRWGARHPVLLRREEIATAGRQLVSTAQRVAELDSGRRFPVTNPSPFRCPGCQFREVCQAPGDDELIDLHFERVLPKRSRPVEEVVPV